MCYVNLAHDFTNCNCELYVAEVLLQEIQNGVKSNDAVHESSHSGDNNLMESDEQGGNEQRLPQCLQKILELIQSQEAHTILTQIFIEIRGIIPTLENYSECETDRTHVNETQQKIITLREKLESYGIRRNFSSMIEYAKMMNVIDQSWKYFLLFYVFADLFKFSKYYNLLYEWKMLLPGNSSITEYKYNHIIELKMDIYRVHARQHIQGIQCRFCCRVFQQQRDYDQHYSNSHQEAAQFWGNQYDAEPKLSQVIDAIKQNPFMFFLQNAGINACSHLPTYDQMNFLAEAYERRIVMEQMVLAQSFDERSISQLKKMLDDVWLSDPKLTIDLGIHNL